MTRAGKRLEFEFNVLAIPINVLMLETPVRVIEAAAPDVYEARVDTALVSSLPLVALIDEVPDTVFRSVVTARFVRESKSAFAFAIYRSRVGLIAGDVNERRNCRFGPVITLFILDTNDDRSAIEVYVLRTRTYRAFQQS